MKILVIAWTNVIRLLRDRLGLFFVFALPIVIIVVFGLAFGGGGARARIGVFDGDRSTLSTALVSEIGGGADTIEVRTYDSLQALTDDVAANYVQIGLAIPSGYEAAIRAGGQAPVRYVSLPSTVSSALKPILDEAVGREAGVFAAARFAMSQNRIGFDAALADARRLETGIAAVSIRAETTGHQLIDPGMNGYVMGAQSQLVLFMFLTSMTAATQLIVSRQLGVSRRMLATPTSTRTILLGELLGRFGVAMLQGLFIFLATALVFGVKWGDPLAAGAVIVLFGLVGTGVAMLVGSISNDPDQANSLGVGVAMLLGAFGGAMVPPEVFPDVMRILSHITPHAWAIDALRDIALRQAGILQVLPQLGVLLGMAAVLLAAATWRFRKALAG